MTEKKFILTTNLVGLILISPAIVSLALSRISAVNENVADIRNIFIGISAALFVTWTVYRTAFAKPRCPNCGAKKVTEIGEEVEKSSTTMQIYRCFRCESCNSTFRIKGTCVGSPPA